MATLAEKPHPTYVLELSQEEAQALTDVLASVGGPEEGPRRHIDAILDALEGAGFYFDGDRVEGYILFRDE